MNKIALYADPGMGKTTFILGMAKYVAKTTGKKTRVITSDGGGLEPLTPAIKLGIIEAVDVSNWANPFATYKFLSEGWWPVDTSVPNSPLVNGFRDYRLCPLCGNDSGAALLTSVKECKACKKPIPPGSVMKPVRELVNGMENVGAYGIEGLTSWGDRLQHVQADKVAEGDAGASAGSSDSTKGGSSLRFQDGTGPDGKAFMVAGNNQPHYGASVDYLARFVRNTDQLPGWKVWTAHERVGKEEETGRKIVGPSLPGRAGTDKCIGWFNSVLRMALKDGTTDRVLHCNTHYVKDVPGVPYRAKLSVSPTKNTPSTIVPATFEKFVDVLDKAREEAENEMRKELGL